MFSLNDELKSYVHTDIEVLHLRKLQAIIVVNLWINAKLAKIIYRKQVVAIYINPCLLNV